MSEPASSVVTTPLAAIETPLLAVALAEGTSVPAYLAALDQAAGGVLTRAITSGDFKGKRDETSLLYPAGGKAQRVLLVGMGKAGDVAGKRARTLGAKQLACAVATEARNGTTARDLGQAIIEGAAQGAWSFT